MTHPTKGEPVAGTATPLTDAQEEKVWESTPTLGKLADIVPAHFARSLESQLTLAREKIAVQEKEIAEVSTKAKESLLFFIPNDFFEVYRRYTEIPACEVVKAGALVSKDSLLKVVNGLKNGLTEDINRTMEERDTARASLAAVTAKLEAIKRAVEAWKRSSSLARHLLSIITQEDGKPTL